MLQLELYAAVASKDPDSSLKKSVAPTIIVSIPWLLSIFSCLR
jgi:hypothetical protein